MRTERINSALYLNMPQGDEDVGDDMESLHSLQSSSVSVTQTTESGVQAQAQTVSSGTQPSNTKMDQFGGTQTIRIKTKEKGNQATEDRTEEIEQLRQAGEIEKQTLIDQHEQNI